MLQPIPAQARHARTLLVLLVALCLLGIAPVAAQEGPAGGAVPPPDPVDVDPADTVAISLSWSGLLPDGGASTALVATSEGFADALASGGAQGALRAPLLLTAPDDLDPRVAVELDRLGVERVVILGGTAAVSQAVEAELRSQVATVERIGGADRLETSRLIADAVFPDATELLFVRAFGEGSAAFADSLAAGAYAAWAHLPVILVGESVDEGLRSWLEAGPGYGALVIGGTAAVSDATLFDIVDAGATVGRVAGGTRFGTAATLEGLADGEAPLVLVDGEGPQAWASGFAAALHAPNGIILTRGGGGSLPGDTAALLALSQPSLGVRCGPTVAEQPCELARAVDRIVDGYVAAAVLDAEQARGPGAGDGSGIATVLTTPERDVVCVGGQAVGLSGPLTGGSLSVDGEDGVHIEVPVELTDLPGFFGCTLEGADGLTSVVDDLAAATLRLHTAAHPDGQIAGQLFAADAPTTSFSVVSNGPGGPSMTASLTIFDTGVDDRLCYALGTSRDNSSTVTASLQRIDDGSVVHDLRVGPSYYTWHCDAVEPGLASTIVADPSAYQLVVTG